MDADGIGRQYMREELFAYVAGVPSMAATPNATWAAYIFGREFADHRHARTMFRSTSRSALSSLLELLNDEERRQVFTGIFDIGNGLEVPCEFQTYAALERELGYPPESGDSVLEPIKQRLQDLLGVPIKRYFDMDRGITLKVLRLLYRYQRCDNHNLGSPQLFSFLRMPGPRRPSFEFNDAHAVRDATDKQRIIDELKVHLGSELSAEQREKIHLTFRSLAYNVAVAEDLLKRGLKVGARGDIERCRRAYAEALEVLDRLRGTFGTGRVAQRLDIDLLIYLSRAQVENRNKAHAEVTDAIKQIELPLHQIEADLVRFNAEFDRARQGRDVNVKVVDPQTIAAFLSDWSTDLREIMGKAFGATIRDDQYRSASENAQKIIRYDLASWWEGGCLSLLDVVALLCTAHAFRKHPATFRYKPYWHGQRNQSNRPFYPLNSPRPLASKSIPEGRIIYWRQCRDRIKYALVDQLPYWELDLELGSRLNGVLSHVMESHDIDAMQRVVSTLITFATSNGLGAALQSSS